MESQVPTPHEMAEELIGALLNICPWPWTVEHDWGFEIKDAKNQRVTLCQTAEMSQAIMKMAEEYVKETAAFLATMKKEFPDLQI